jgi:uncharacterized damage-inducible protein DinB
MLQSMPLAADAGCLLVREVDAFLREIALFPDDDSLWQVVPGVSNPAGTLALHIAGNLQHFVGAVLGGTGYVRDRPAEFRTRGWSRDRVVTELMAARQAVEAALGGLDERRLDTLYPAVPNGLAVRTDRFLVHLVAHTAFHLGQAGYIRRVVTGDATSANPLPLAALVDTP